MHWTHLTSEWNQKSRAGQRYLLNGFRRLALPALVFISALSFPPPCFPDSGAAQSVRAPAGCVVDYVDRIEINHVLDADGNVTLDQVIYWDYSPSLASYVVIDWRTLKNFSQVPYRRGLLHVSEFYDTRDTCRRKIVAGGVVETFTSFDPETANQELCDRNFRRGLRRPEKRKAVSK